MYEDKARRVFCEVSLFINQQHYFFNHNTSIEKEKRDGFELRESGITQF